MASKDVQAQNRLKRSLQDDLVEANARKWAAGKLRQELKQSVVEEPPKPLADKEPPKEASIFRRMRTSRIFEGYSRAFLMIW